MYRVPEPLSIGAGQAYPGCTAVLMVVAVSEWMSPAEIGEELNVPTKTVYGFVRDDGLPAIRIGKHLRISRAGLAIWVNARLTPGTPSARERGVIQAERSRLQYRRTRTESEQQWKLPRDSGDAA